jgi:hypothetical protein
MEIITRNLVRVTQNPFLKIPAIAAIINGITTNESSLANAPIKYSATK